MALLERVNTAGRIYDICMIRSATTKKSASVATKAPEQMPPQFGVKWTCLPLEHLLEHSDSTRHAHRNWRFYLRNLIVSNAAEILAHVIYYEFVI